MGKSRIPAKHQLFRDYLGRTDNYLQAVVDPTNWARLTLTEGNKDDWHTFRTNFDVLDVKYTDPLQKTPDVIKKMKKIKKDFKTFAQPKLNVIAACPAATETDGITFNVVIVRSAPTHRTTPIASEIIVGLQRAGNGKVKVKNLLFSESKKASLAPFSDRVEYAYSIGSLPSSPADCSFLRQSSKALFTIDLTGFSGKTLYIFCRWADSIHPELNGTWSDMYTILIG